MLQKKIKITNSLGLHARPSTLIVRAATKYRCDFYIEKNSMRVNGKSIMGVMMLAAECGSELNLIADGIDEEYLLEEIEELIKSGFGED
ncbi:MAG: HPr family phosphocarrier protein [Candidatus Cloacimonetes bacterium]|nr:HPr family phosphocarrier protein [Candidatus Cloacimonadota bacterium]MDD4223819.1 HPr family phosphocarrier protein [Candidatus Cloacimonadota bacterium]